MSLNISSNHRSNPLTNKKYHHDDQLNSEPVLVLKESEVKKISSANARYCSLSDFY